MVHNDPHAGQLLLRRGPSPASARITVILVHGRGASAEDILTLADLVDVEDVSWLAPQAAGHIWYPQTFLAPLAQNEPWLTSALARLRALVDDLGAQGVPAGRVAIGGFSQGACLSLEFAARHARRYAGILGFSGGLIGPPGTPRQYPGSLEGTPVFIGCSDVDAHIPVGRVHESAAVLRALGADVDERIYPGMGHTISADEISAAKVLLSRAAAP